MNLQMATRHALFAVLELASRPDEQLSALDIADRYDISANHLAKVLRVLGRAGIVEAVRGVGGGYRFVGKAKRLSLMDIVSLFEPIGSPDHSTAPGARTPQGQALRLVMTEIEDTARSTLSSITVETMLKLAGRMDAP
ncbi:Rrf2 family transcriptional regulator [Phaeovibrio sulfidiphilus]|uniref:Rrf2 family transcriptional regulator n=1 Tax=Phaeovibrio sulfidiphilus TaxID=1220600 RepID=A0A8J6YN22_9PROT|nr:Rrf2 family transcriptional regulator [Phaeovibrio sulfidiphilus]MBE1237675.1 Rrf2 family transcriptional regulator [Phaeovibrio sulfidiphilus]